MAKPEFRRIWTGGWLEVWQKQTDAFVPSQNVRIYWITIHSHAALLAVPCQVLLLWFNNWTLAMTGLLCLFGVCSLFLRVSSCWCGTSGWLSTAFRSKPGFWQTQQAGLDHTSIPTETRKDEKQGEVYLKRPRGVLMTPPPSLSLGICSEVYVHGLKSVHEQAVLLTAASQSSPARRRRRCLCSTLFAKWPNRQVCEKQSSWEMLLWLPRLQLCFSPSMRFLWKFQFLEGHYFKNLTERGKGTSVSLHQMFLLPGWLQRYSCTQRRRSLSGSPLTPRIEANAAL